MADEVLNALGAIQRSLGTIEGKLDGHMTAFKAHVEDDQAMARDIRALEISHARQRGFLTAIGTMGSIIGAGIGYLIERFLRQ